MIQRASLYFLLESRFTKRYSQFGFIEESPTMTSSRDLRIGVAALACTCVIGIGGGMAEAQWERLADLPMTFGGFTGMMSTDCFPFLVADDGDLVYVAHGDDLHHYNLWLAFDTVNYSSTFRASPFFGFGYGACLYSSGNAGFADGRVYVGIDYPTSAPVYIAQSNFWSLADLGVNYWYFGRTVTADNQHEHIYWFNGYEGVYGMDPDVGPASTVSGTIPWYFGSFTALNVWDNRVYIAGGFQTHGDKGIPYFHGDSTSESHIYDFNLQRDLSMCDLPHPASAAGSAWGTAGLHFIGWDLEGQQTGSLPPADFLYYEINNIYHFIYDPIIDTWQVIDDLPVGCLPLAAAGQNGWLYGLFSCEDPDPSVMTMYRTYVGTYDPPPTTTPTTTTTTMASSTTTTTTVPTDDNVDDDSDDWHGDDDLDDDLDDDATPDDDTTDAAADGDDDDGGCGL